MDIIQKEGKTGSEKAFLAIIVLLSWFAVIAQFYLQILNRVMPIAETITRFFSFYTILTNLLVAISASILLFKSKPSIRPFFSRPGTLTAIAVHITVVALVYNLVLRALWSPTGLQRVLDEMLHVAVPILFVLFWLIYVPKTSLKWNIAPWLIYPLVYLTFVLIRGACSGFYPYPFLNVTELGYGKVAVNCSGLFLVFVVLSLFFVLLGKLIGKRG